MLKIKKGKISATPSSSAVVVDGKLILTLLDSLSPVVWQMDLDQAKSSALEIVEDKKKMVFSLMLRNTKGEVIEIAPFENKDLGVKALMLVSQALQEARGRMKPQAAVSPPYQQLYDQKEHRENTKSNKWGAALAIGLIFVLLLIWAMSVPRPGDLVSQEAQQSETASGIQGGVPVSADDFLSKQ